MFNQPTAIPNYKAEEPTTIDTQAVTPYPCPKGMVFWPRMYKYGMG